MIALLMLVAQLGDALHGPDIGIFRPQKRGGAWIQLCPSPAGSIKIPIHASSTRSSQPVSQSSTAMASVFEWDLVYPAW